MKRVLLTATIAISLIGQTAAAQDTETPCQAVCKVQHRQAIDECLRQTNANERVESRDEFKRCRVPADEMNKECHQACGLPSADETIPRTVLNN